MFYYQQTAAALIAQGTLVASREPGNVHVWSLPQDGLLLRTGKARLCDHPSLGDGEIVYHLSVCSTKNLLTGKEHSFCATCGFSDFPKS